jgi:hypothetical protein
MREMSFIFPPPPSRWPLSEDRWYADLHAGMSMQLYRLCIAVEEAGLNEAGFSLLPNE